MKKFLISSIVVIMILITGLVCIKVKQTYSFSIGCENIEQEEDSKEYITPILIEQDLDGPSISITSNIKATITCDVETFTIGDVVVFKIQEIEDYYVKKVTVNGFNVDFIENSFEITIAQENLIHVEYEKISEVRERGFDYIVIALIILSVLLIAPIIVLLVIYLKRRYK